MLHCNASGVCIYFLWSCIEFTKNSDQHFLHRRYSSVGGVVTGASWVTTFSFPAVGKQQRRLFLVLRSCCIYQVANRLAITYGRLHYCQTDNKQTAGVFLCSVCTHCHFSATRTLLLLLTLRHTHYTHIYCFFSSWCGVVQYNKGTIFVCEKLGNPTSQHRLRLLRLTNQVFAVLYLHLKYQFMS